MFKFIVLLCVALWLLGLLSGGKLALIKSSNQLVRLLIMLAIGFTGVALLDRFEIFHQYMSLRALAVIFIVAGGWAVSGFITNKINAK